MDWLKTLAKGILDGVYYRWNVAKYSGEMHLKKSYDYPNLDLSSSGIRIYRDEKDGVAHIYGKTFKDVIFGQGFVFAQERLFQLEIVRRFSQGRLGMIDKKFLLLDRFSRTLGFHRIACEDVKTIKEVEKERFELLRSGINAFIKSKLHWRPLEMILGGLKIEEFSLIDVITIIRFNCFTLNVHGWMIKLINEVLEGIVSKEDFECIYQSFKKTDNTVHWKSGNIEVPKNFDYEKICKLEKEYPSGQGSNCFVVSGKHTESGKPIIAADCHLDVCLPSIWVQFHLVCEEFEAAGLTFLMGYGIQIGHNEHIAYGITLSCMDAYEMYKVEIHPENKLLYKGYEGEWKKMDVSNEIIKVKGEKDYHVEKVRMVPGKGVILSDVWSYDDKKGDSKYAYALLSTCLLHYEDGWLIPICEITKCKNFESFMSILMKQKTASVNVVYCDNLGENGNIGYYMTGAIPIRSEKAIKNHSKCVPSWDKDYEWKGFVSPEKNPHCYNPKCGYVVSCNHKIVTDDYPFFLGNVWVPGYRAKRITKLINQIKNSKRKITENDCKNIQQDITFDDRGFLCNSVKRIIEDESLRDELFSKAKNKGDITKDLIFIYAKCIHGFDGVFSVSSVGATCYKFYQKHILHVLLDSNELIKKNENLKHALIGAGIDPNFYNGCDFVVKNIAIIESLFKNTKDDSLVTKAGGEEMVKYQAIIESIISIRNDKPDVKETILPDDDKDTVLIKSQKEINNYVYGKFHTIEWKDNSFGLYSVGPFPCSGSRETVSAFGTWDGEKNLQVCEYPSCRFIQDMKFLQRGKLIFPPGQSSNPSSKHHSNNVEKFLKGEYNPLIFLKERDINQITTELFTIHTEEEPTTTTKGNNTET